MVVYTKNTEKARVCVYAHIYVHMLNNYSYKGLHLLSG